MKKIIVFLNTCMLGLIIIGNVATAQMSPKVDNIIFMIGDGMGVAQIYAGLTLNGNTLNLEQFKCIGFSKTNSATNYITESAAGATAFAIGEKTHNRAIGVDINDQSKPTILEIAEQHGFSTGLVVTTDITDATPAAFVAHVSDRDMQDKIASAYVTSGVDVFIGAGKEHFSNRKDGKNLIKKLKKNNYQVAYNVENIAKLGKGKIAGLLPEEPEPERDDQLEETTKLAIKKLNKNPKGFFLMVEGSQIDNGGHENDTQYVAQEVQDFDRVIGKVLNFAKKDGHTLVVVTADHETGGLAITDGNIKKGEVKGSFATHSHTAVMVPVFAYGPGAKAFMGIYNNNTIFRKFMNAFKFTK